MPKLRTLGALLILAATAQPAFAQSVIDKPLPSLSPASGGPVSLAPSDVPPIDDADTHRAWQEMSREWEARQRSGANAYVPYASVPYASDRRIATSVPPADDADTHRAWQEMSREWEARQRSYGATVAQPPAYAPRNVEPPLSPQERAETRRDWEEMSREWDARQRGMAAGGTMR